VQKASRPARAALARETLNLDAAPPPVLPQREPPLSSAALPVAVPLVGLGLMLLLGASVASARRIPWPGVAERVYARRLDLAAFGFGAIALALLWLNVTVLF
jgi:Tfp pilus assembly protein FimV